jgi:hypothetical protein
MQKNLPAGRFFYFCMSVTGLTGSRNPRPRGILQQTIVYEIFSTCM